MALTFVPFMSPVTLLDGSTLWAGDWIFPDKPIEPGATFQAHDIHCGCEVCQIARQAKLDAKYEAAEEYRRQCDEVMSGMAFAATEGEVNKAVGALSKGVLEKVNGWTFEDGAVVELRSGSAPMTVHASLRGRNGIEYVQVCYWHGEEACEVYDLKAVVELKRVVVG
jgi:hypothetical protein